MRDSKEIRADRDRIREETALTRGKAWENILRSKRFIKAEKALLAKIKQRLTRK